MSDLLANPVIQSGLVPFVVALVVIAVLNRAGAPWSGLCLVAGFAAAVYLTTGFNFSPLTSTRKIILLTLCAPVLGLILDHIRPGRQQISVLFFILGAGAALWVIWPVLARMEFSLTLILLGGGLALYAAWIVLQFARLPEESLRTASAALTLSFGAGITALVGASALYGQMALSITAASAAMLLWRVTTHRNGRGAYSFALTAATPAALIGVGAVVYAKLPWPALILLALVPVSAFLPLPDRHSVWLRAAVITAVGMVPAILAIIYVWQSAGPVPM